MSPVIKESAKSSASKGIINAPENGHPRTAPIPNHIMPTPVLSPPRQSMKAAIPSIVVYMEKLDGRYATEA